MSLRRKAEWHDRTRWSVPSAGAILLLSVFFFGVRRGNATFEFQRRINEDTWLVARSFPMTSRAFALTDIDFSIESPSGTYWAGNVFGPYDPTGKTAGIETSAVERTLVVTLPPDYNPREREVDAGPWHVVYRVKAR